MRLPGFSPNVPPAPPPPPTPDDPAIAEARKKLRQSELKRRGRAASILTGQLDDAPVNRPQASTLG